jgi:predicted RNase H-like HicB family nuclease
MMKYLVVFEQTSTSVGAYVPDLPGCVAVADSEEEVERLIEEAITLHLAGMREDNLPIPKPTASPKFVEVV